MRYILSFSFTRNVRDKTLFIIYQKIFLPVTFIYSNPRTLFIRHEFIILVRPINVCSNISILLCTEFCLPFTDLKPVKEPETETITQIMALSQHSKAHANNLFHFFYFELEETQTHSQSTIHPKKFSVSPAAVAEMAETNQKPINMKIKYGKNLATQHIQILLILFFHEHNDTLKEKKYAKISFPGILSPRSNNNLAADSLKKQFFCNDSIFARHWFGSKITIKLISEKFEFIANRVESIAYLLLV